MTEPDDIKLATQQLAGINASLKRIADTLEEIWKFAQQEKRGGGR